MPVTVGKSALLYVLQEIPLNVLENTDIQCTGFKVTQHIRMPLLLLTVVTVACMRVGLGDSKQ